MEKKFKLIYIACDGRFLIEVYTGMFFIAENHSEAMMKAIEYENMASPNHDLSVSVIIHPAPCVLIRYDNKVKRDEEPTVVGHKMALLPECKEVSKLEDLILNDIEISEKDFLAEYVKSETDFWKKNNIRVSKFEFISFGLFAEDCCLSN